MLNGAIYVAGDTSAPGPDLAESGPVDSLAVQAVAAAAAVGLGASFVVGSRRRRAASVR